MKRAPIVNPVLAKLMANERDPVEALAGDQVSAKGIWAVGLAQTDLLRHGRVVKLACGHYTLTKATHRSGCPRCGEMIRAGYDHDAFRRQGAPDEFSWPDDPFRAVHEPPKAEFQRRSVI
ncbi:hypothetical protein p1B214 (plasmid) [Aromatoleum aromaticum EbN1]|uniref:Uncharacterized protein n=1 Tax=Aromatoleum aromaticum (strain DSM 19018 / LMG 30748 / EbN1) TaxID=76114 RepID=Q5NX06_AROAE|nr:hypothetical protein [Aromatoleum aromaticum]CAI10408.1 hypothetical protein p1B214 [Aromatoleum aromaticum EbN1]